MFRIDSDKTISYFEDSTFPRPMQTTAPGALNFSTEKAFAALADAQKWTREFLEEIWNGFAGVVPFDNLKLVKKFRNRPYGIKQIWNAIQRLIPAGAEVAPQSPVPQTNSKPPRKRKGSAAKGKVRKAKKAPVKTIAQRAPRAPRSDSNLATLISMIGRKDGASIEEVMEATGWTSQHTVRGRISILGSKGTKIESFKDAKRGRVYRAA